MRAAVSFILVACLILSCQKNKAYQVEGTLTGADYAMCLCCGGVILEIDNATGNFRIDSLPFMSVQQLYNLSFPKRIKFNYSNKNSCGGIERFAITEFFMK
jgi:hypothetical protein